jgi:adenylate cyclase
MIRTGIALLAFALAFGSEYLRPAFVTRVDEGLRDSFIRLTADEQAEDRLVVIDINEASLTEIGPWPWPRQRVADLAEILLSTYGARAVGLDIVFPEPGDIQGDARLASLAAHAPVNFAQVFDYSQRDPAVLEGVLTGGRLPQPGTGGVEAHGFIANHVGLSRARCVGNIGYLPDADGVLRHTAVRTRFQGRDYPHFASALISCAQARAEVPAGDENGLWRVPYRHALSAYTVISAADILGERVSKALISGRYVLVGASSLGLGDRVSTPLAPLSAGVMVHATSLSGLLDLAEGRTRAAWSGRPWMLAWCMLSIALAMFFIARLSAWGSILLLIGLVTCWLAVALGGVANQAEWSVTAPLWAYFFLLLVAVPHEWWQAQRRSGQLLATFSHYVAQPVLDEIVRLGLKHSLEPTLRDVTVLIADMEDYTRTTSSLSLQDAARLTKDFLGCLTRPVLDRRGTLDKYTGDGLVAFWGAPLDCPDQADWAVSAALAILEEVDLFNAQRRTTGLPPVRVRIGIESGRALVGDLGTAFRSTYTAVGDCINFASRLESAARDLPTRLVIGVAAKNRLEQHTTVPLGHISLRGTATTIEVFTVPSELMSTAT